MSCSKKLKNGELLELIAWGRAELSRAGIGEAQEECERALMKFLGCSRSAIYLEEHGTSLPEIRKDFLTFIEKRVQRIPLAYLLKEADFWHETLYVDERCLIPRPETEILVEVVVREMKRGGQAPFSRGLAPFPKAKVPDPLKQKPEAVPSFLDIGTGSGAIAIALLREFPGARGTLLDISPGALEVARMNLEKYGLEDRATVVLGDVFNFLGTRDSGLGPNTNQSERSGDWGRPNYHSGKEIKSLGGTRNEDPARKTSPEGRVPKFDLIVSNPPYLSETDLKAVQKELEFEPRGALAGGKDGLNFYKRIIADARDYLTLSGLLALEVGQGQAGIVSTWLQTAGYDNIQRFKDYLGIERVVTALQKSL